MKDIDDEFAKLEEEVRSRLNEAARLIDEANKLVADSKTNSRDISEFMYNDNIGWNLTDKLFGALDRSGWRTSSLGC